MGKHIGGIVYDIAAAMVGAAAAKVLSVLKTTKIGSKIASTLSKAKCKIKTKTIGKITGKTYCFTAGTPVLLPDGMKPIEEIRKGDWVWSVAPETGDPELKQVEDVFVNETDEIVHVRYGDTEIDATPTHPFYTPDRGWVSAVNLRAGDRLQLVNGEYVTVEQVQHEILESPVKVYNFEVQDNHTYYVGVLVHNRCQNAKRINFTQDSISPTFRDGRSLDSTIQALKKGTLKPNDLPEIRIFEKNGKLYSLDNRRLYCAQQAGVKVKYRYATQAEIKKELPRKFTTKNNGKRIRIRC